MSLFSCATGRGGAALYKTVAHDKGKPVARQGRKAVSLSENLRDCLVAEGDLKTSLDFSQIRFVFHLRKLLKP
jgi:hypothetical protein